MSQPVPISIPIPTPISVPTPVPSPTPAGCSSACGKSFCTAGCDCTDQPKCETCKSTCNCPQKVRLYGEDRKAIAHISKNVKKANSHLETLTRIATSIQSDVTSLKTSDSADRESHISQLLENVERVSDKIDQQACNQNAQNNSLNHITDRLQTVENSLNNLSIQVAEKRSSADSDAIRSATNSLNDISTALASLKSSLPLIGVFAALLFLLLLILNILELVLPRPSSSTAGYSITPIPIPVPSPVYTPTPIPIPVPSPVYKPISSWHVKCTLGHDCLRVRRAPHLSAPVIQRLSCSASGIQITGASVDSNGEIWVPVEYQRPEGQTVLGWVVRRFLHDPNQVGSLK